MNIGFYSFGSNTAIDKFYQILLLLDSMIKDERFNPLILTDGTGAADRYLLKKYQDTVTFCDLREVDIDSLNLSAVVVITPYIKPYIPYKDLKVPVIYKEYGVAGVEKNAGFLIKKDVYKYADLIITENDFMKDLIHDRYPDKEVLVGSPAFDYIFSGEYDRFSDEMFHVLWTPHHSIVDNPSYDNITGCSYSSFLDYWKYLTGEYLEGNPDIVLHMKPHPILRSRYNHYSKDAGLPSFSDILKSTKSKYPDRFFVHEHEDYHTLFVKCDLCLNDSISFIQEWLVTKKPMIILKNSRGTSYSEYGELLIKECYTQALSCDDISRMSQLAREEEEGSDSRAARSLWTRRFFIDPSRQNSLSLLDYIFSHYSKS